jgi:hypothetical protein
MSEQEKRELVERLIPYVQAGDETLDLPDFAAALNERCNDDYTARGL